MRTATADVQIIKEEARPMMELSSVERCLHPDHGDRAAKHHGTMCTSCYQTVIVAVRERRTSWEDLRRKGKVRLRVSIEDFWLS